MKTPFRAIVFASLLFALCGTFLSAQDFTVQASTSKPKIDGNIGATEYASSTNLGPAVLYASLDGSGVLYLALKTQFKGWAAIGLGSTRMDGSSIFMAYAANGKGNYTTQLGSGHRHSDASDFKALSESVTTSADGTVFELSVSAKAYVKNGAVALILAASNQANFVSMHAFRSATTLTVKN
jgi:hypothetical protein